MSLPAPRMAARYEHDIIFISYSKYISSNLILDIEVIRSFLVCVDYIVHVLYIWTKLMKVNFGN